MSNRIDLLFSMVTKGELVMDVGSDHGKLPILLVEKEKAKKVIASDISKESINKIKRAIGNRKLNIEARLADGLKGIKEPYPNTVVISGMGSGLIINILEDAKDIIDKIDEFIFQPNTQHEKLRRHIHLLGMKIVDERTVYENNYYYTTIKAVKGKEQYTDAEYLVGKILIEKKDALTLENIQKNILRLEKLLNSNISKERVGEINFELELLKEALNAFKRNNL